MNRLLLLIAISSLGGCAVAPAGCDNARVNTEYEHVSHPFAGPPFGPKEEEDSLDSIGLIGRCEMGRTYIETGAAWRLGDGGFYGPDLIGTVRFGVTIWSKK